MEAVSYTHLDVYKRQDVCREFGLVNSTVGSILKNKDKILKKFEEHGEKI